MTNVYASLTGTAVIQLKDVPQRPKEYDGRVIVYKSPAPLQQISRPRALSSRGGAAQSSDAQRRSTLGGATGCSSDQAVVSRLQNLLQCGDVINLNVLEVASGEWIHAQFKTHEQARGYIDELKEEGRGASTVYNETHYDRKRGEPYSGWCVHPLPLVLSRGPS